MKAIIMSIRPKWVYLILQNKKTIEIRKTAPKCQLPIDVYVYCTMQDPNSKNAFLSIGSYRVNGRVIAKFTLRKVEEIKHYSDLRLGEWYSTRSLSSEDLENYGCLAHEQIDSYLKKCLGFAWHISNLQIFYSPKELREIGVKRAPQSWQYIEVEE